MNLPKPEVDRDTAMELWIREHSDYAKEQLVLNNIGIIGIVLKSLNLDLFDEDLFATGLLGLVKAINKFDSNKMFTLSAYATRVIRNEILITFRKKRIMPAFSLDEPCNLKDGDETSYADMIADSAMLEEEVITDVQFHKIFNSLSERERLIISLRNEGKNQSEIAEICGVTQAQISKNIKRTHKKFKEEFN